MAQQGTRFLFGLLRIRGGSSMTGVMRRTAYTIVEADSRAVKGSVARILTGTAGVVGASALALASASSCSVDNDMRKEAEERAKKARESIDAHAEQLMDRFLNEIAPKLSFGFVAGLCSGYCLKKVGQGVAFMTGAAFMTLQGLAYLGYVEVKWHKVASDASKVIDADGDGTVTGNDFKKLFHKFVAVMSDQLPGGAGFGSGVIIALRYM